MGNGTENIHAYNCLRKRLQGIQQASESQTNEKLNGEGLLSMWYKQKRPGASLQPAPKKLESYKKIKLFICISEIQI